MQTYKNIKISSHTADITILDDGSDTELYGKCTVDNNCLIVELTDDSTLVIPRGHYESISVITITGDCSIKLEHSVVDQITVKSTTGDIEVEANTDNVSMESTTGECVKKGASHKWFEDFVNPKKGKKTMFTKDDDSVDSFDVSKYSVEEN